MNASSTNDVIRLRACREWLRFAVIQSVNFGLIFLLPSGVIGHLHDHIGGLGNISLTERHGSGYPECHDAVLQGNLFLRRSAAYSVASASYI